MPPFPPLRPHSVHLSDMTCDHRPLRDLDAGVEDENPASLDYSILGVDAVLGGLRKRRPVGRYAASTCGAAPRVR